MRLQSIALLESGNKRSHHRKQSRGYQAVSSTCGISKYITVLIVYFAASLLTPPFLIISKETEQYGVIRFCNW